MYLSEIKNWLRRFHDEFLLRWKPIHLCWLFKKMGWKIPKYLIGTSANYDLTHYVFATDSGDSDPDAQTFGDEDDPITSQEKETQIFIRFQVRETNGAAGSNSYWQLYYNTTNDPSTASQVTTTGDGVVKIVDDTGSNIANASACDSRIMSEYTGETFISGEYSDNQDDTNSKYQLDSSDVNGYTEFMWSIQFESGADDGQDYYFYPRVSDSEMDSHSVHPKITTAAAADLDVNVNDENPDVTDEAVVEITPYLINQYDDKPDVTDYAEVIVNYAIKVDDNVAVEDDISQYLSLYEINVSDELTIQDETLQYLILYEINVNDNIGISDEAALQIPILEVNVNDSIGITDEIRIQESIFIYDIYDLQDMEDDLDGWYILANNIDATPADPNSGSWDSDEWGDETGFRTIGTIGDAFTGEFDGAGYNIDGLFINRPLTSAQGLFGMIGSSNIYDVNITNADITGLSYVGSLCGYSSGVIQNCSSSGEVTGAEYFIGGLVGWNNSGTIDKCSFIGDVTGAFQTGGLLGYNVEGGIVSESYSIADVSGTGDSPWDTGGLIGYSDGTTRRCYSAGTVSGDLDLYYVGGLIGSFDSDGEIENCFSLSAVSGYGYVGGLVGDCYGDITNSYSAGGVSGTADVGGLIGKHFSGTISDCFWDKETSGQESSDGGTGKTTSEMKNVATFTDTETEGLDSPWDFVNNPNDDTGNEDYWHIGDSVNNNYPYLTVFGLQISGQDTIGLTDAVSIQIPVLEINVNDDIGVQESASQYLTLYEISTDDDVTVQEDVSQYINPYLINQNEMVWVEEPVRQAMVGWCHDEAWNNCGWCDISPDGTKLGITSYNGDSFSMVDISDPTNPTVMHTVTKETISQMDGPEDIKFIDNGNKVIITCTESHTLLVLNVSNPYSISYYDHKTDVTYLNGAEGIIITDDESKALVCCYYGDMVSSWDISDLTDITMLDYVDHENMNEPALMDFNSDQTRALIACAGSPYHLFSINCSNFSNLSIMDDFYDESFSTLQMVKFVTDDYAVLSCSGSRCLDTIDTTDLDNLAILDTYYLGSWGNYGILKEIDLYGTIAYLSTSYGSTISEIDVSNKNDIQFKDTYRDKIKMNGADDVKVRFPFAFVSTWSSSNLVIVRLDVATNYFVQISGYVFDINVDDDIGLQDETIVETTSPGILSINQNDDLTIEDSTSQYLTLYEINVYDDLTIQEEKDVSISGAVLEISVYDEINLYTVTIPEANPDDIGIQDYSNIVIALYEISVYDEIGVQDESQQYLTLFEIYVSDILTTEDSTSQYLTIFEIYAYDDIAIQEDRTVSLVGAGVHSINVYDDLTVQDESAQYLTIYEISLSDNLTTEDSTSQYLTLFEIYAYDSIAIQEEDVLELSYYEINVADDIALQESISQYLTVYRINTFDFLTIQDESAQYLTIYEINVSDDITVQEERSISIVGAGVHSINVYDDITVQEDSALELSYYEINVYDSLLIQDECSGYLTIYEIYLSDAIAVEESISLYLSLFEIYAYDQTTIQEYTETYMAEAGVLAVNVYDDLNAQEEINNGISPYLLNVHDNLAIQENIIPQLSLYEISAADNFSVTDEKQIQLGEYEVSAYDNIAITDYMNELMKTSWAISSWLLIKKAKR